MTIKNQTNLDLTQGQIGISKPGSPKRPIMKKYIHWYYLFPALIALIFVFLYPMIKAIIVSFYTIDLLDNRSIFSGLANYGKVINQPAFLNSVIRSLIWTAGSVSGQMALGLLVALLLNEKFKGVQIVRSLVLIPWIMPGLAIGMIWKFMLNGQIGVINDVLVKFGLEPVNWIGTPAMAMFSVIMINIWKAFPFAAFTLLAGLSSLPKEMYEAAEIDGAGVFQRFRYITLPSLKHVSVILALLLTVWTFNYFDVIFTVTDGGPAQGTETLPILVYHYSFKSFQYGLGSSTAMIIAFFNIILALLYLRLLRGEGK